MSPEEGEDRGKVEDSGETQPEAWGPGGWGGHGFRPRRSPPWWPEGEPWPPTGSGNAAHWRTMRGRFFRRVGCVLAILALAAFGLFTALLWFANNHFRPGPTWYGWNGPPPLFLRFAGPLFILFILTGLFIAGRAIRRMAMPVGNLLDASGRIADGDYAVRVPETGPGEVRGLARSFNSMAQRLEATDQQRRALLADITHELRTPITIIQGNLEGMLDGVYPADPQHIQATLDETHVLSRIIDDLRTLSLAETGALKLQSEPSDLAELVEDTTAAFQPQAAVRSVTLRTAVPADLPTLVIDPTRIREVLANLLSNALRYTPSGGEVWVRVEAAGAPPGEVRQVHVSVQDSGEGIDPADLPHIFDRFYKSADSRGTGLGLAIAKSLVAAHGGEIHAQSATGQGTTITFTLPVGK